jgi:hypothetical protein
MSGLRQAACFVVLLTVAATTTADDCARLEADAALDQDGPLEMRSLLAMSPDLQVRLIEALMIRARACGLDVVHRGETSAAAMQRDIDRGRGDIVVAVPSISFRARDHPLWEPLVWVALNMDTVMLMSERADTGNIDKLIVEAEPGRVSAAYLHSMLWREQRVDAASDPAIEYAEFGLRSLARVYADPGAALLASAEYLGTLSEQGRSRFRIIETFPGCPLMPVLIDPELGPQVRERLKAAFRQGIPVIGSLQNEAAVDWYGEVYPTPDELYRCAQFWTTGRYTPETIGNGPDADEY